MAGMNQGILLVARKRAGDLDKPDWSASGWQRFIPNELRVAWPSLSEECRAVAFLVAEAAFDSVPRPKK